MVFQSILGFALAGSANRSEDYAVCFKISHQCGVHLAVLFPPDDVHNWNKVKLWTLKRKRTQKKEGKGK